jgi:S1-C subfamily serine protease
MAEDLQGTDGTPSPEDQPDYPDAPMPGSAAGTPSRDGSSGWGQVGARTTWGSGGAGADSPAPAWGTLNRADQEGSAVPGADPGDAAPPWGEAATASWGVPGPEPAPLATSSDRWGTTPTLHSTGPWAVETSGPGGDGHWYGDDGPRSPGPRRRYPPLARVAGLIATILVAAGAGAAIALAVSNHGSSPRSSANRSSVQQTNGQGLNVRSIAAGVEPATVDITAKGSQGDDEGTGMVISPSGMVLTNNHVIDQSTQLSAQIDGTGKTYNVAVLGTDAADDVALLQLLGGSAFKTVALGNSGQITVGDPVVAIGNALGLSGPETVTNGIISATGRAVTVGDESTGLTENLRGLFQTSAPINPGNSGGPLVDASGQVIGMNTAQASGTGSGQSASDVGFAIPIDSAMAIAHQIQAGQASSTVQIGPHAIMGVEVTTVACADGKDGCPVLGSGSSPFSFLPFVGSGYTSPVSQGAVVSGVEPGDPAQAAGLASGDVITSINGTTITSPTDLTGELNLQRVGDRVTVDWVNPRGRRYSATLDLVAGPNA